MRIALVSEHASPLAVLGGVDAGGQNVHVASLATSLADHHAEVVVYTRRDGGDLPLRVGMAPGVVVEHVTAGPPEPIAKDELLPHMDAFGAELHRLWNDAPPDVVHAHFWMSGLASLRAASPLGIPVLQTFHALGVVKRRHQGTKDGSPPARIDIEASIVRRATGVIATCGNEAAELLEMGAEPTRLAVIPCGVDLSMFRPDGPAAARPPSRRRLVVVSRLVERKGIGNVIAALPAVPDTELLVAGGPPAGGLRRDPEARRLRALARRHGVADRVTLLGQVSRHHLPLLLRSADAVVCVPWYEPFGIVPLEAMACGVPVVASAVGGLRETVVDGVTGIHVPPRRPDVLGPRLARLLDRPPALARMGRAGLRRARERYGWPSVAAASLDVYRRALDQTGRTTGASLAGVVGRP